MNSHHAHLYVFSVIMWAHRYGCCWTHPKQMSTGKRAPPRESEGEAARRPHSVRSTVLCCLEAQYLLISSVNVLQKDPSISSPSTSTLHGNNIIHGEPNRPQRDIIFKARVSLTQINSVWADTFTTKREIQPSDLVGCTVTVRG